MGKFDSYFNPPDEPAYCDICGLDVDSCICPECDICGEVGNPKCYEDHGMIKTQEQINSLKKVNDYLQAEAEAEIEYFSKIVEQGYEI